MSQGLIPGLNIASVPSVQANAYNWATDTGVADAYVLALIPAVAALTPNFPISFTPLHNNATTTPTVAINGLSALTVVKAGGALASGDMLAGVPAQMLYSAVNNNLVLVNPKTSAGGGGGVTATQVQANSFNAAADTGAADAYVVVLSPVLSAYVGNMPIYFTPAHNNATTTPTLAANALAGKTIVKAGGALAANDLVANVPAMAIYSAVNDNFVLLNPQTVSGGGGGGLPVTVVTLPGDVTNSTGGSPVFLTGLTFTPVAGKTYRLEGYLEGQYIDATSDVYIGVGNDPGLGSSNTLVLLAGSLSRPDYLKAMSATTYQTETYGFDTTENLNTNVYTTKEYLFFINMLFQTVDTTPVIFWVVATNGGITFKQNSRAIFTQLD